MVSDATVWAKILKIVCYAGQPPIWLSAARISLILSSIAFSCAFTLAVVRAAGDPSSKSESIVFVRTPSAKAAFAWKYKSFNEVPSITLKA